MSDRIVIEGIPRYNGDYPVELADRPFTMREFHLIKKISGVRLGELMDAMAAGDTDVIIAMAVIALIRNQKISKEQALPVSEALLESDVGSIIYVDDEEAEPVPPPSETGEPGSSEPSSPTSNENGDAPSATIPPPIGTPASPTGSPASPPTQSANSPPAS
jgi:hypothetical protein